MSLRLVPYDKLARVAEQAGFSFARRGTGSHCVFRHSDGRIVTIPDHGSQVIVRSLLRKILRDLGLTVNDYHDILDHL